MPVCLQPEPAIKTTQNIVLGPLADNGGDTQTHAISGDSPAVDSGTEKGVPNTDQRGYVRPQALGYDIGAFERVPKVYFVNSSTGSDDAAHDGSSLLPWASISYAISRSKVGNGDVININGTFTGEGSAIDGITVNKSLTLQGQPLTETIVQAHATDAASADRRCFTIAAGAVVTLQFLTIQNGNPGSNNGGGILNSGRLNIESCTLKNNIAVNGGGIYSETILQTSYSTISGNTVSGNGGGIYTYLSDPQSVSSGIDPAGDIHFGMVNCTVANNSAGSLSGNGGGFYMHASSVTRTTLLNARLINVTLADNTCGSSGSGSGLYRLAETTSESSQTHLWITNCIISNGTSNNYADGTSGSNAGHSLDRFATLCRDASMDTVNSGNLNNTDPQLSILADNGGNTRTMALLATSPAIDSGTENGILHQTDQRGLSHVNEPDMGSYEYGSFTPLLVETKIFLQGAYNSTAEEMNTSVSVPIRSPYQEDERTVSSVPDDIVDWVLVELRSTTDGAAVASKSAFLRKDGLVVGDDGTTTAIEMTAAPGNYYLVIKHRNHLTVMSDEKHTLSVGLSTLYDFTMDESSAFDKYYGGDAAVLETSVYGMYGGETNNTGTITTADKAPVVNDLNKSGYHTTDTNFSGTITTADKALIVENLNKSTAVN
ncbi:MAG: choice-of-anchor Q domain-containing protein [candidate division KSB1 bacterium]|nr:choice-of-anchor Q domain-containing protein [candidate division KSB1 bacterium]